MKKTMFITSVIMVVVMAIALTTSSLAWFTASGTSSVTTTALTITSEAKASSGIQISVAGSTEGWGDSVTLVADTGVTGATATELYPLMPLAGNATPTKALLIDALAGTSFIGNYIAQNGKFALDGGTSGDPVDPYTTGFFVDDLWITNVASGSSAAAQYITASCVFTDDDGVYSVQTADPNLFVAVLADTDDEVSGDTWEIVAIFNSKNATTVNVGRTDEDFESEHLVASAYSSNLAINTLENNGKKTSTALATAGDQAFGTAKHFRVVAWYDGSTLNNNNSGFAIKFALTFTASAS